MKRKPTPPILDAPAPYMVRRVESKLAEVVAEIPASTLITNDEHVAKILRPLIASEAVEVFVAIILDGKHRPTGYVEIARGTLTHALIHPREVFGPAIRMGAAAIIVAHNHPSGDPWPSSEDLALTRRLYNAGVFLGIQLIDHVVLGASSHVSIFQQYPQEFVNRISEYFGGPTVERVEP